MNVLDFKLCVSDRCFKQKAKPEEYAGLRATFKNKRYSSLNEFKEDLEQGKPFIPCSFDETIKENGAMDTTKEHVEYGSAIVMDFENGDWTEVKFRTFCEKYDILPNIFYHSFSSTSRAERFRAIWIVSKIYNEKAFSSLSLLVKLAFDIKSPGGIDTASLNEVQQYHATNKEVKILNKEHVDFENFIKAIYDMKDFNKAKSQILKETGIEKIVCDKLEYESSIGKYSYRYERGNGRFGYKFFNIIGRINKGDKKMEAKDYNNTNSDYLIKRCQLVKELTEGKQNYYNYNLSTGLVYSLVKMRNGKQIYKNICDNNASSGWKKKEKIFDDIKKKDYMPMSCSKIGCPYYGICNNKGYSPADLCKPTFKHIENKTNTLSISEARTTMYSELKKAYSDDNYNTVSIIEAPVGTGKTYATIDLINDNIAPARQNKLYKEQIKDIKEMKFIDDKRKKNFINRLSSKIQPNAKSFIIASPRHNLCEQIVNDLYAKSDIFHSDVVYITPRPTHPDSNKEEEIRELEELGILKLGKFKEYLNTIKEIRQAISPVCDLNDNTTNNIQKAFDLYPDDITSIRYGSKDYDILNSFIIDSEKYIDSREASSTASILVCTHSFLSHIDLKSFNQNIIFIDEDCSESFIETKKIKIKTIEKMISILNNNTYKYRDYEYGYEDIVECLEYIMSKTDGRIHTYDFMSCLKSPTGKKTFKTGLTNKKLESLIELKRSNKIDLTTILNLKSFYVQGEWLSFTTFKSLNTYDKKVILTSATPAPDFFYSNIFNKTIEKCKVPFVELKGKLIQYVDMYCFRKDLKEKDYIDRINEIKRIEKVDNIISYKAFNDELSSILNFGNLEGINEYEGKDIIIAGTYIVNPIACQLISHMFDNHNDTFDIEIVRQKTITYNNIEQKFTTFDNENSMNYQLWQCWKTIEQAVGRARLVSNNCKVVLLSKMIHPLSFTTTYEDEIKCED